MVSVRTVLDMPELRLTVRAGGASLTRDITRLYGTELPDPGRFLSGGELVLTGLLWLRDPGDVHPFVAALADRHAAALIACDADTGVIPDELVAECARRDVPLLEASVDLSFADVIERVGLALAGERAGAGRSGRLVSAVARGAELSTLLTLATAELGVPCRVLTRMGRVVASAGPELAADRIPGLVGRLDGHAQRGTIVPVLDPGGPDLTRWFLLVDGDVAPELLRDTVAELAGLIGVQRQRDQERRQVAGQVAATVLRAVRTGTARPAELDATAVAAGIDPRHPLRVLAASAPGAPGGHAAAVLDELVATVGLPQRPGVVGVVDDRVYALLPAADGTTDDPAARATAALALAEPALTDGRIVVGVSSVVAMADLRGAIIEADHARELGERQPGRTRVVAGGEVAVHQLVLAGVPGELRRALRRRVLGPVFDYDATHDADLVHTLSVFLDCSGSWARAAARLHVHVNTLRYRIGRVEELIGVDLADFAARVDVYLALRAGL